MTTLYADSLALGVDLRALLPALSRRDPDLARRFKRSYEDVEQHVGESMCVVGRERRAELTAAARALHELLACITAAVGVGHLERQRGLEERIAEIDKRLTTAVPERRSA